MIKTEHSLHLYVQEKSPNVKRIHSVRARYDTSTHSVARESITVRGIIGWYHGAPGETRGAGRPAQPDFSCEQGGRTDQGEICFPQRVRLTERDAWFGTYVPGTCQIEVCFLARSIPRCLVEYYVRSNTLPRVFVHKSIHRASLLS